METTLITSSSCSYSPPFPLRLPHRPMGLFLGRKSQMIQFAHKRDTYGWDYGGGLVDENMIVLRKRIHEMKMAEMNYEAPSNWMDWERRYYASYQSDVCGIVGLLQKVLMNTRPSLAIGMMALLVSGVPTSMVLILMHLMEASSSILCRMHLK
uniref:Uncharacterized protein LOC105041169 n=1 Tax=Elaeis guineensis var. tenera TaxID=51953 RepID=A0A6I9QW70_ELAGV|nr:uncharacterized protein LOC105041169 [Elaeis guineensis]